MHIKYCIVCEDAALCAPQQLNRLQEFSENFTIRLSIRQYCSEAGENCNQFIIRHVSAPNEINT